MPPGPKKRRAAKRKKEKEQEEEKEKVAIHHHHLPNSPTTPLLSPQGNGHHDLIVHQACNCIEGEVEEEEEEEEEAMKNSETVGEKAEPEMIQKPEAAEEAVTTAAAEEAKVVDKAPDVPSPGSSETGAAASEADVLVPIEQGVEVIEEVIQGRKDILSAVAEEVSALAASTSREREVKVVPIADEPEETAPTSEGGSADASPATEAVPRAPVVADRATWWKCCGLLDVFASSGR